MSVGGVMLLLDFVMEKKQILGFPQIDFVSLDSLFFCLSLIIIFVGF